MRISQSTVDVIADAARHIAERGGGLNDDERDYLAWMDGLLTAAVVGPERTHPHEWVAACMGEGAAQDDPVALQALTAVFDLRYNLILERLLRETWDYEPQFLDDCADARAVELASRWTNGFVRGIRLRHGSWIADASTATKSPIAFGSSWNSSSSAARST